MYLLLKQIVGRFFIFRIVSKYLTGFKWGDFVTVDYPFVSGGVSGTIHRVQFFGLVYLVSACGKSVGYFGQIAVPFWTITLAAKPEEALDNDEIPPETAFVQVRSGIRR